VKRRQARQGSAGKPVVVEFLLEIRRSSASLFYKPALERLGITVNDPHGR
jgi:hypothetical protein